MKTHPLEERKNLTNPNKVKKTCSHCRYVYRFDTLKQTPSVCPYCGRE